MTYLSTDQSIQDGSPTLLYRFTYGATIFRYCSLDGGVGAFARTLDSGAEIFLPTTITTGRIEVTEEMSRNNLDIRVPDTNQVAALYIAAPPDQPVLVTIWRLHITDQSSQYVTMYKGRVMSCSFSDSPGEATLTCESIFTSMRRSGLRQVYDPMCPHDLFDSGCGLVKEQWQVAATVGSASSGASLVIPAAANYQSGYFTAGVFECGPIRRMITAHVGNQIVLMHSVPLSVVNSNCLLRPGCPHTLSGCAQFGNVINFGGFPWMPLKNPFSGDNVFWG